MRVQWTNCLKGDEEVKHQLQASLPGSTSSVTDQGNEARYHRTPDIRREMPKIRDRHVGGTAKHLKIGRLKSVLPENLLIRQLSDLAFGSRFVNNCPSVCFFEINIVPRTAPSTQCQQKKVTSIHVLGRSLIRMKCLAAFHAKPQASPYRQ